MTAIETPLLVGDSYSPCCGTQNEAACWRADSDQHIQVVNDRTPKRVGAIERY
jgi:hypothetical protein